MQSQAYDAGKPAQDSAPNESDAQHIRAEHLRLLALAEETALEAFLDSLDEQGLLPGWNLARGPEAGLVMIRGRIGGQGQPFNVGEALVTRCCVRLSKEQDILGCGYVLGERPRHAEMMAVLDALWQKPDLAPLFDKELAPVLARALQARYEADRAQSAATKVDFFTMVRGEDKD